MTVKPILFSGPMIRALIEGRKTQTRRVFKLPTKGEYVRPDMGGWAPTTVGGPGVYYADGRPAPEKVAIWNQTTGTTVVTPYQAGDLLWVRETFSPWSNHEGLRGVDYKATTRQERPWRPSIHMPREFSRLTLEVTGVKVERLQDISEEDAIAEGIARNPVQEGTWIDYPEGTSAAGWLEARLSFRSLWNSINAKRGFGWDATPWVVAVTFTVHQQNVDALLAQREAA